MIKISTFDRPRTARSRSTRICIGEAVIRLMKEKSFEEIRVNDIVREAGVSRMTYYKYYTSKLEVLKDYLNEIIIEYDRERKDKFSDLLFRREQILHCIRFFVPYASLFHILSSTGQYTVLATSIKQYINEQLLPICGMTDYELYYYSGAMVGMLFRWLANGKQETPEQLTEQFLLLSARADFF